MQPSPEHHTVSSTTKTESGTKPKDEPQHTGVQWMFVLFAVGSFTVVALIILLLIHRRDVGQCRIRRGVENDPGSSGREMPAVNYEPEGSGTSPDLMGRASVISLRIVPADDSFI